MCEIREHAKTDEPAVPRDRITSLLRSSRIASSGIEDWLGLELASDTAIEYPSVAQLAHFVAGRLAVKGGGVA